MKPAVNSRRNHWILALLSPIILWASWPAGGFAPLAVCLYLLTSALPLQANLPLLLLAIFGSLAAWNQVDSVLGLGRRAEEGAPAEIVALLEERQAARKAKDFKRSDAVRDELKARGWVIEDTPKGPRLKRA